MTSIDKQIKYLLCGANPPNETELAIVATLKSVRDAELPGEPDAQLTVKAESKFGGYVTKENPVVSTQFAMKLAVEIDSLQSALQRAQEEIHIVFDGPPSHESGRFVEVETADGKSVNVGRWEKRGEYWHLIIGGKK